MYKIFVINIGSSSLKVALFEKDITEIWSVTKRHDPEKIRSFPTVYEQIDFRMEVIDEIISEKEVDFSQIDVIA